jgi:hypothetical protein
VNSGLVEASLGEPMIARHRAELIATLTAQLDSRMLRFGAVVDDFEFLCALTEPRDLRSVKVTLGDH